MSDTPAAAAQGLASVSQASIDEMLRNALHRVDAAGNREQGLLEILSAIAQNTAAPGIMASSKYDTVAAATTTRPLIVCPGSSRIVLYAILFSVSGAANITLSNQRGTAVLPTARFAAAGSVDWHLERGFMLPAGTSLTWTNSAAVTAQVLVSYAII